MAPSDVSVNFRTRQYKGTVFLFVLNEKSNGYEALVTNKLKTKLVRVPIGDISIISPTPNVEQALFTQWKERPPKPSKPPAQSVSAPKKTEEQKKELNKHKETSQPLLREREYLHRKTKEEPVESKKHKPHQETSPPKKKLKLHHHQEPHKKPQETGASPPRERKQPKKDHKQVCPSPTFFQGLNYFVSGAFPPPPPRFTPSYSQLYQDQLIFERERHLEQMKAIEDERHQIAMEKISRTIQSQPSPWLNRFG